MTFIAIPMIILDGIHVPNELTLIVLVVMFLTLGIKLNKFWPNPIQLSTGSNLLWNWSGVIILSFIAILLILTIFVLIATNDYTELGLISTCITLCANMRMTIPDWISAIKSTNLKFK